VTGKYEVNITQHAQDDLEHIFYYIASDSVNNASKFILELEKKVYSLEAFPERNPFIPENEYFGTDYRHLIHKKYRIIYRVLENTVFILRIIQGAKLLSNQPR
jgi:addiction module RelE/StbE family toxin